MPKEFLFVCITSHLIKGASLMFLEVDQDPPLRTIDNAIQYVMLWPWKLTKRYLCHGWGLCVQTITKLSLFRKFCNFLTCQLHINILGCSFV
jgi:hypothetical protein